ncbi:Na+/H+-dicarboxylate symporter [Clostridium cavendishii DSM 21758]|uniref:Na+/H+-dicarboxylate symporter n=1 Tax=Clostridium cavendishii DSM 21758 TaxID=1121302 RepID=A0A1M6KTI8_9CLOT|nr:dicarboxylate/amino acid:cation symporter [Clostridium cavendishii]SHJ62281.1 Na+/H+-dicarboxylate symporter [Clostridium cavendishii DSM 21758]
MKKISLITKIFIALILGITLGLVCKSINLVFPIKMLTTFSSLFGSFLSFVIPLIIIGFIVPGIASLGNKSGKTLLLTTIIAYVATITAGFCTFLIGSKLLPKLIQGGILLDQNKVDVSPIFKIDIPPMMDVMSALVFAFILGIGLSSIKQSSMLKVMDEFSLIVGMIIKNILIPVVPFYIACIFAKLSFSGEIFSTLKAFGIVYLILFSLQALYILAQYSIAGALRRENPFKLFKNMIPAFLTAVGTQSSAATIPVTLASAKNNKVSEEIAEFVIPLTATIHLAGDTITLVLTSMGVMYMNGNTPTFGTFIPFIFMLGITMVAAPGIPGGGVMAALGLLQAMLGFGSLEKPIMIALHAAQDSFGTATNVSGDGAIAMIVDEIINRRKVKTSSEELLSDNDLDFEAS